jgi:predicted amidohydrolase YtcJ
MSQKGFGRFAAVMAFAMLGISLAEASAERTIFHNGKVFTSDPANLYAEGVVVEDRYVIAVGSNQHILQFQTPNSTLVNLQGRTLIPGFNDAHVHPFDTVSFPRGCSQYAGLRPGTRAHTFGSAEPHPAGCRESSREDLAVRHRGEAVVEIRNADRFTLTQFHRTIRFCSRPGTDTAPSSTRAVQMIGIGEEEPDPFEGSRARSRHQHRQRDRS